MDAIRFILNEHAQIRKAFASIKKSIARQTIKKTTFNKLAQFLARHEAMEEKVWYPKLRSKQTLNRVINLLIKEEKKAAKVIKKIKTLKDNKIWQEHVLKLALAVNHHAHDEEKKLFPKVRKILERSELDKIGLQLSKFKARRKTGKRP